MLARRNRLWGAGSLATTVLLTGLALAGCAKPAAPDADHTSTVSVASALCVRTGETRGEGFAGPFTEIEWTVSASGTATGPPGALLTVRVHAPSDPDVGLGWYGDLEWSQASWQATENQAALQRAATDPEGTDWAVTGIRLTHTDHDADPSDDPKPTTYGLTATAGESGFEAARATREVECR